MSSGFPGESGVASDVLEGFLNTFQAGTKLTNNIINSGKNNCFATGSAKIDTHTITRINMMEDASTMPEPYAKARSFLSRLFGKL